MILTFVGSASGLFAFRTMFLSYVYVPAAIGPTDACTVLLLGYTFYANGEPPVLRTASSIPVTTGCRIVSIYPDSSDGIR